MARSPHLLGPGQRRPVDRGEGTPTPGGDRPRLGATSPAHALDVADLTALYRQHRDDPGVALKRQLWTKLLTTALGTTFHGEDELFVEHTLLVTAAEIIAHAVVGFDPTDPTIHPATLLNGQLFASAQIGGIVESDFFDWPVDIPGGTQPRPVAPTTVRNPTPPGRRPESGNTQSPSRRRRNDPCRSVRDVTLPRCAPGPGLVAAGWTDAAALSSR